MKIAGALPATGRGRSLLLGGTLGVCIALLDALVRTALLGDAIAGRTFAYHLIIDVVLFGGLGALVIQGLVPGPQLFKTSPVIVYGYAVQMFLGSALLVVLGGVVATVGDTVIDGSVRTRIEQLKSRL